MTQPGHTASRQFARAVRDDVHARLVVIGSIIAATFITAGPALYGRVTGDNPRFAPLHNFLQSKPNATEAPQAYL